MRIGILGYGKMGKAIEQIATDRGHEIAWRISTANRAALTTDILQQADVAIEFTQPAAAYDNAMACLSAGIPFVCGTTGWTEQLRLAENTCRQLNGAMIWASNFSIGVNLFFALNRFLAQMMNQRPEYDPEVRETHHIHKLDAPSGTALTLTQDLVNQLARKNGWTLHPASHNPGEIPVYARREGEVPGTHSVTWKSNIDEICIEHKAHSRIGFAAGAVMAAEWIQGKNGVFSMQDVLNIPKLPNQEHTP